MVAHNKPVDGSPLSREEAERTVAAVDSTRTLIEAAELLCMSVRGVQKRLQTACNRYGLIPKKRTVYPLTAYAIPDGFKAKGTSTLYDEDGAAKLTWLKTTEDAKRQEEMLRETVASLVKTIRPAKPLPAPSKISSKQDLLVAYCIGDAHVGLYSWGAETGQDFDLTIAEQDLVSAMDRLTDATPRAAHALVAQLGDFYHMDDNRNATPRSGNLLDVDSRFPKVIRVGVRVMRHTVDRARAKHDEVQLRNVAGNHDPHASITLTEAMIGYYCHEPRVVVEDSPRAFWHTRFGSNLIGITHGHGAKPEKFPGILAVDAQRDWGECDFKYIWHGHVHSKRVFEEMGVIVESFRTLSSRDAWHTEQGYRPGREMQAIVLHRNFGEIERHTVGIKMVREGRDEAETRKV